MCLLVVCAVSSAQAQQAYDVGYAARLAVDSSRSYPSDVRGRPVFVQFWYPTATRGTVTYQELIDAPVIADSNAVTEALRQRTLGIHAYVIGKYFVRDSAGLFARVAATRIAAARDAQPLPGRFPIVVYGAGAYNSTEENVTLWRTLASHGFIVAVIPSQGERSVDLAVDAVGLETQARDLEFALALARRFPDADGTRVGAMGFSYGGAAALIMAMRNDDVRAIAGLDPSFIGGRFQKTIQASPSFDADNFVTPVMELHRADNITYSTKTLELLRYAPRYSVTFNELNHVDFNSYVSAYLQHAGARADSSAARRARAYSEVVEQTVRFMEAFVKGDSAVRAVIGKPTRPPLPTPPTVSELRSLLERQGFPAFRARVAALTGSDPGARVIGEATLNQLGYDLKSAGKLEDAVSVFLLNVQRHPTSANVYDSAADVFEAAADNACRAASYRKVLQVAPHDQSIDPTTRRQLLANAAKQLKSLPATASCRRIGPVSGERAADFSTSKRR